MKCGNCACENDARANYCNACGMRILRGIDFSLENSGERRNMTVMFSDLVGSTQMSADLDPEQWHLIVTKYQQAAVDAIGQFGGHVGKFLGDGIMAYFGYPHATEDSAECAVNAGLAIIASIEALNSLEDRFANLKVRVGLHAGSVVVAPLADVGADIFGDVPNISARVQSAAKPNSVVMTKQVYQAVAGKFRMENLGMRTLAGIDNPLELFRAESVLILPDAPRLNGSAERNPIIGRDLEIAAIRDRFRRARNGKAQFVLVSGEAGIGKSRLLKEMRSVQAQMPGRWIECTGRQLYRNSPFHGAAEILYRGLGLVPGKDKSVHVSELENALRSVDFDDGRIVRTLPILATIMGLAGTKKITFPEMGTEKMRDLMFDALKSWIRHLAGKEFVTLVFEDLHWVDHSTLELIEQLAEDQAEHRLLVIATSRPGSLGSWPNMEANLHIELGRLRKAETRELIMNLISRQSVDGALLENIADRVDGVPLFAEALVHLLSDSETRPDLDEIPGTLHDSLAARVDRSGSAKQIAQLAAVIGREFSYEILSFVSDLPEPELKSMIAELVEADLICEGGDPPGATYNFTHALLRDAAYGGLLKKQQKILHKRVAETLHDRFEGLSAAHPQMLARHWAAAEEYEKAWGAWKRAAKHALTRYAYREAADAFEQAIAAISRCPPDGRLDEQVALWQSYVGALQISCGYSAPQTQDAMHRARKLIDQTGDPGRQFTHTAGEWMAASGAGDYLVAEKLASQLSLLANKTQSAEKLATSKMILLTSRYRIGNLEAADAAFKSGLQYFQGDDYRRRPGAVAQVYGNAAINAWIIGEADEAWIRIEPVLELAETSTHQYEKAFSGHMASMFCLLAGDDEKARDFALSSVEFAEQGGFPQFVWNSMIVLGRAQAKCGDVAEGMASLRKGLEGYEATRSRAGLTTYLTWFAATQYLAGSGDAALETLNRALSINPNERYYRPESLRIRGEIFRQREDWPRAQADLLEAEHLADAMGAKAFQTQITKSIRQLRDARGQRV